jgi:hypothetical protein
MEYRFRGYAGWTAPPSSFFFQDDSMETGSEEDNGRRCPTCHGCLKCDATVCPCCGSATPIDKAPQCVIARGGRLDQDAVVTPTRRIIEMATAEARLTEDQGEFLLDLLIRVRPLHSDRRKEFSRIMTDVARESDAERRRKALWALRGLLREIPALEDTVHALFVKFEL